MQYERVFVDMNEKEHKADWYTKVCHTAVRCRFICCKKRVCTGARLLSAHCHASWRMPFCS